MDINLLIQRLRHGDNYTIQDGCAATYQVNNPPNHLMIKAADVIVALHSQTQQANEAMLSLQCQLEELNQQYETLRNSGSATAPI